MKMRMNMNDIDCELCRKETNRTFVRRAATAETGNRVPLGPPKSRYLYDMHMYT